MNMKVKMLIFLIIQLNQLNRFGTSVQTIITNLELGHYTEEDFFNQIYIFFENNSLETIYCPKINNFNYSLDGLYTDYYFKFSILNL